MNRTNWLQLERWYTSLHRVQQWLFKIAIAISIIFFIVIVTHEPKDRPRQARIILNCDQCGTDPERVISYNEYMDKKEQTARAWVKDERQRIRQEAWDEQGRNRFEKQKAAAAKKTNNISTLEP
jgi:hypothetical protein